MGLRKLRVLLPLISLLLASLMMGSAFAEGTFTDDATCGTQRIWMQKMDAMGKSAEESQACSQAGPCDVPANRDAWIPDSAFPITYVRMVVHILRNDDGSSPISTPSATQTIIDNLNEDYLPSKFQFEVLIDYVNSTAWRLLSEGEISSMKANTAYKPDSFLNVWATQVDFGYSYGTFPWDNDALTAQGGIVMGHFHWNTLSHVFAHEVGHCLGLYHTFNGVDEVSQCGACYEAVNSPDRDVRGDRCSDTDPAPTITGCSSSGTDPCSGQGWGPAFNNLHSYMSYSSCIEFFTTQQMGRMQCWTDNALSSLISNVRIEADKQVGRIPLEVEFNGLTAKTVNVWDWDFGDGGNGGIQQPLHTYTVPGLYDVSVTIQTDGGDFTTTRSPFIAAHADTASIIGDDAVPGDMVEVVVTCHNYVPLEAVKIPFSWAGPLGLNLIGLTTEGLRSNDMGTKQLTSYDPGNERAAFYFSQAGGELLPVGNGPILKIQFEIPGGASGGPNPVTITDYAGQELLFETQVGDYVPASNNGEVGLSVAICGDVNDSGGNPNILDVIALVQYLFASGPTPPHPNAADVNGFPGLNILDVNYLVSYLFASGPPLMCF